MTGVHQHGENVRQTTGRQMGAGRQTGAGRQAGPALTATWIFGPARTAPAEARSVRKTATFVFTAVGYGEEISMSARRLATGILGVLLAVGLAGCASVKDTAMFYVAYTPKVYPPKPPKTPIPILARMPKEPHKVIGALKFESDQGWKFMRRSMIYNAQVNGADAVVLEGTTERRQLGLLEVPPQMEWVPVSNWYRDKKGRVWGGTSWIPFYRPGYVQPYVQKIIGIDAKMIVLE